MDYEQLDATMAQMFMQMHAQFGNAVKAYWMYDGENCPGCQCPVSTFHDKGKEAVSLNTFIYRKRGVLIGYLLCGRCIKQIMHANKMKPGKQIALHDTIEATLGAAFEQQLQ